MSFINKILSFLPSGSAVSVTDLSVGNIPEGKSVRYDEFVPCILKPTFTSIHRVRRDRRVSKEATIEISDYLIYVSMPNPKLRLGFKIYSDYIVKTNDENEGRLHCYVTNRNTPYQLSLHINSERLRIVDSNYANLFDIECQLK